MSSVPQTHPMRHPTFKQYVVVATFLFVVTIVEFLLVFPKTSLEVLDPVVTPLLILLSTVKFATVIMFYMHLRFDSRLFTGVFTAGLALGLAVGVALLVLFGALRANPLQREFAEANAVPYEAHEGGEASPESAEVPAGGSAATEITAAGDALAFNRTKLTASAGQEVVLRFKNTSTLNQHNWVLVKAGTKDAVAAAGAASGPANAWVPLADDRMIAHTQLVGPGQATVVRFQAPAAGSYQFVCTFPGHNVTMFGELEVTQQAARDELPDY